MSYENSSYHKKWWVKTIRERNFFGFRYWWFNWSVWTLSCFFLVYGVFFKTTKEDNSCLNKHNLSRSVSEIEKALDLCCSCNVPPPVIPPPIPPLLPPPNAQNCNTETRSGNDGIDVKPIVLGTKSGMVTITFDMFNVPDKLEVFYENSRVASTFSVQGNTNGFVGGNNAAGATGRLRFSYRFNREQFVKVRVTGGSSTTWTYTVGCPN